MSEIGRRIFELRTERLPRLTQRELAERAGLSVDLVQKLEQGRKGTARIGSLAAIAAALDVDLAALLGKATHLESVPEAGGLQALRRALTPVVDEPGDPVSVEELQGLLGDAWSAYWKGDYDVLSAFLPAVIANSASRAQTADVHAEACQVAAYTLVHLGHSDLSLVAVDKALAVVQDPLLRAGIIAARAWVLLNQTRAADALVVAVREADAVEPTRRSQPAAVSMWGNLLVTGATAAARAGDDGEAQELLQVAHGAAARLGEDRDDYHTLFGVGQVVMQQVDVAVVAGNFVKALDVAKLMPQRTSLALAARARHKTDVAHAHAGLGQFREAEESLLEVERMAPRWMRYQVFPRAVVGELLGAPRPSRAVVGLARRLGVA